MATCQLFIICFLMTCTCNLALSATTHVNKNGTINILCLLPYNESPFYPSWSDGPQLRLALEMAQNEINNQSIILPNHRIELIHGNSACQFTSKAYEALLTNVYSQVASQNVIGMIGPGCSSASMAVSSLISRKQLSLVAVHSGGSLQLADRTRYPNALGALGSAEAFVQLTLQLMIKYNWGAVSILFEETRAFYSSIARRIVELTSLYNRDSDKNLDIVTTAVHDTYLPLEQKVMKSLRIKFLLTAESITQRTLCLAKHLEFVYPAYQWVIIVNTFDEIATEVSFIYEGRNYTCSKQDMENIALNRSLFLVYQLSAINDTLPSTYSTHTFKEYDQIIQNETERFGFRYSVWTTYFYDTLWAWSVVLDKLGNIDFTLSNYGNTTLSNMILDEFYNLDFEGVSGRIKFSNESGFVQRPVAIIQVVNSTAKTVAFLKNENQLVGEVESIPDKFPDQTIRVSTVVIGIFISVALLQLVVLVTLNILTIIYRKYPSVKASSIKLNQLIFIGCYLSILTIILFTVTSSHLVNELPLVTITLCNITWYWLLPLSFTLSFGTVAVRTWRLYRIFTHYLNPGRFITDQYLTIFVFILTAVDVIIGVLLTTLNPQLLLDVTVPSTNGNATFLINVQACRSPMPWLTILLLFGYRALLMLSVLILAFLTTNIWNSSFTTKSLRVLIYLVTTVMVLGFVIYYIFYFQVQLTSVAFYSFVLTLDIVLLLFVALVCVPPLLPKLKEKYCRNFSKQWNIVKWNTELSS